MVEIRNHHKALIRSIEDEYKKQLSNQNQMQIQIQTEYKNKNDQLINQILVKDEEIKRLKEEIELTDNKIKKKKTNSYRFSCTCESRCSWS